MFLVRLFSKGGGQDGQNIPHYFIQLGNASCAYRFRAMIKRTVTSLAFPAVFALRHGPDSASHPFLRDDLVHDRSFGDDQC